VATNPRIDDLRRRLDREPQSRLFAQLAEELRKEGDLREAIQVARRGLEKHPNYPSARMTLGRALFDSREFGAARGEFESVVKGAPDNILASRLLGECLEALGDVPGAIERYKATLVFSPGDKQVLQRLEALEKKPKAAGSPAAAEPASSPSAPAARAPVVVAGDAPIPLVEADEEFELERPLEAGSRSWQPQAPRVALASELEPEKPAAAPAPPPAVERMMEFELEAAYEAVGTAWAGSPQSAEVPASVEPAPFEAAPAPPEPEAPPPPPVEAAPPPPPPTPASADDLTSATLAELYFNQGALDRAADAYRRLLEREPGNERFRARLAEIERLERHLRADEAPAFVRPSDPEAARRERLEGTVARLEGLLAAIKRGVKA
jgi:tetratricopeptide (TPR) repeat protein